MSTTRADIIIRMQAEQAKRESRDLAKGMAELERELKQADRTSRQVDQQFSQLAQAKARAAAAAGRYGDALGALRARLNAAERGSVEFYNAQAQLAAMTARAERSADQHAAALRREAGAAAKMRDEANKLKGSGLGDMLGGGMGVGGAAAGGVLAGFKALELGRMGAQIQTVEAAFKNLASTSGQSADALLQNMRRASGGTVSDFNLMKGANLALLSDIEGLGKNLPRLLEIARGSASALGIETSEAYGRLIEGITKAEPELLDELGIRINLNRVYAEAAQKLGTTASAMTQAQKAQAVLNAVLTTGGANLQRMGNISDETAQKIAMLGTGWNNFLDGFKSKTADALAFASDRWEEFFQLTGIREGYNTITAPPPPPAQQLADENRATSTRLTNTSGFDAEQYARMQAMNEAVYQLSLTSEDAGIKVAELIAHLGETGNVDAFALGIQNLTMQQQALTYAQTDAARANEMAAYWAGILAEQERVATFATGGLTDAQRALIAESSLASAQSELLALQQQKVEQQARGAAYALLESGEAGRLAAAQYAASADPVKQLTAYYYELARAAQTARLAQGIKDVMGDVSKQIRGVTDLVNAQRDYAYSVGSTADQIALLQTELNRLNKSDPEYWRKQAQLQGLQQQAAAEVARKAKAGAKAETAAAKAGAKAETAAAREAEQALRDQEREADRLERAKYNLMSTEEKLAQKRREYAGAADEATRLELTKEIRDLEKEITDAKDRQVDAALQLQQAMVKNGQQQLDDLKRAEQARRVLNSQTASAEQKARARLALQEIAADQATRKAELDDLRRDAGQAGAGGAGAAALDPLRSTMPLAGGAADPLRSTMPLSAPASSVDAARYALMRGSAPVPAPALSAGQSGPMRSALDGVQMAEQTLTVQLVMDGDTVAEKTFPKLRVLIGQELRGGRAAALAAGTRQR